MKRKTNAEETARQLLKYCQFYVFITDGCHFEMSNCKKKKNKNKIKIALCKKNSDKIHTISIKVFSNSHIASSCKRCNLD